MSVASLAQLWLSYLALLLHCWLRPREELRRWALERPLAGMIGCNKRGNCRNRSNE